MHHAEAVVVACAAVRTGLRTIQESVPEQPDVTSDVRREAGCEGPDDLRGSGRGRAEYRQDDEDAHGAQTHAAHRCGVPPSPCGPAMSVSSAPGAREGLREGKAIKGDGQKRLRGRQGELSPLTTLPGVARRTRW